jgi:group II intron reverse transcriptase/maturase
MYPTKMAEKQAKLAQTAVDNPDHRFTGLYDLMHWRYWIEMAAAKVLARPGSSTAGVDGKTRDGFERNYETEITRIVTELKAKTYEPQPVRRTHIPKGNGKTRPLGIPILRDRIVQEALRAILDPIYESDFQHHSYGFRKGRCTMDAVAVIMPLFNSSAKHYWVIEGDIKSYFDNVHHRKLMKLLRKRIADKSLLDLIWKFLKAGVMEGKLFAETENGVPQGGVISPLLANVYLNEFDKWAEARWHNLTPYERSKRRKAGLGNYTMVRYADDFVIVSNGTKAEIEQTKEEVKRFLDEELHLELSAEKTLVTHINDGFEFLGFHIQRNNPEGRWVVHLRPTEKNKKRVKNRLKELTSRNWTWMDEHTRLTSLNRIVKGWCMYYRYTSLLSDLEEVTRYVWHRYLKWLLGKHKGSRKQQHIRDKTAVINNRTRWTATIVESGEILTTHQWLPTQRELKRERYRMKGRGGFLHHYLNPELARVDNPEWEGGPDDKLLTETIGATSRTGEPLELAEMKLRRKMRDKFTCQRCGSRENLEAHHKGPVITTSINDLITLCFKCHQQEHKPDSK